MELEKENLLKSVIRDIPDFPVEGILFRDLTTAFKNPDALRIMSEELKKLYADKGKIGRAHV